MAELIHHFGIDGKLLLAQAVNFFVLLFLLKKFAYHPILRILKKRREEIQKGILYARQMEEKVKQIELLQEQTLSAARQEALQIVTRAEAIGEQRKEELVEETKHKTETMLEDAQRSISHERARMGETFYRDARVVVARAIEKVIGQLSPEERSQVLIQEALQELRKNTRTAK